MQENLNNYVEKVNEVCKSKTFIEARQYIRTQTDTVSSILAIAFDKKFDDIFPTIENLVKDKNWELLDIFKAAIMFNLGYRIITNPDKTFGYQNIDTVTKGDITLLLKMPDLFLEFLCNYSFVSLSALEDGYTFFTSYNWQDKSLWQHCREGKYNFAGYSLGEIKKIKNIPDEVRNIFI